MEHLKRAKTRLFLIRLFSLGLLFLLTACDQPLKNPELSDLIYKDLEIELKKIDSKIAAEEKTLSEDKSGVEAMGPRDPHKNRAIRDLQARAKQLVQLKQKKLYQELLLEKRLDHIRRVYPKIYAAKEPWPDPDEFEVYQTQKRLQAASRNWNDRIPKLKDRTPPKKGSLDEAAATQKAQAEAESTTAP